MKRSGVINTDLVRALGSLRHTDVFVVTDAGMSAPVGAAVIDLSIVYGLPTVTDVLRAILDEVVVEQAWVAAEQAVRNPLRREELAVLVGETALDAVPHERLREIAAGARFFVRTGDDLPYSNIVLRAGVGFAV